MTHESDFTMTKWYLDCVSERGDACICYAATLRWGMLSLHYASVVENYTGGTRATRTSFARAALPALSADTLHWTSKRLGVQGSWRRLAAPVSSIIFSSQKGKFEWRCHMPAATAEVSIRDRTLRGIGYAESVETTIKPWEMGIERLMWGRYATETESLVWIGIDGLYPQSIVFHNGEYCDRSSITNDSVTFGNESSCMLDLHRRTTIREGTLLSTSLSSIPGIARWAPAKMLRARERKWLAQGRLQNASEERSAWVMHEEIDFRDE